MVHVVLWERWDLSSSEEGNNAEQTSGGKAFQAEGTVRAKAQGQDCIKLIGATAARKPVLEQNERGRRGEQEGDRAGLTGPCEPWGRLGLYPREVVALRAVGKGNLTQVLTGAPWWLLWAAVGAPIGSWTGSGEPRCGTRWWQKRGEK